MPLEEGVFLRVILYVLAFVCFATGLRSQSIQDNVERIAFTFQNDFFNKTDYYYTNGLFLSYESPVLERSPFFFYLPASTKDQYDSYGVQLEHRFYTPTDTHAQVVLEGDRPYASYLLLSNYKETRNPASRSTMQLQGGIGIMGRYSGGKEIQTLVHAAAPDSEVPMGWHNQLASAPLIDVQYRHQYDLLTSTFLDIGFFGSLQVGTLKDQIGFGATMVTGLKRDHYKQQRLPVEVWLDVSWRSDYVVYNALLQGGYVVDRGDIYTISSVAIERMVHHADFALHLGFNRFSLVLQQSFLTPEFGGGRPHSFGGIKLGWEF